MRKIGILLALLTTALTTAVAAPVKYTVQTQLENVNVMTVESETDIENFTGRTNQVSGTVNFDAAARTGSASITVNGKSISTGVTPATVTCAARTG